MKMPYAESAHIEQEKLVDYLLNPAHPDNGGKAAFFGSLGYERSDWRPLAKALRSMATVTNVAAQVETQHGMKYIIDGVLKAQDGKSQRVRTVWIVNHSEQLPRLVSAYPGR